MVALKELVCVGKGTAPRRPFLPPLRHLRATSSQGEAFCKAHIEGSCRQNRLRGGDRKIGNGRPMISPTDLLYGKRTSRFTIAPLLRATSPQGKAFCKAHIEGSCRQPMIALTKYKNAQKNTAVSAVSKTYTYWGE